VPRVPARPLIGDGSTASPAGRATGLRRLDQLLRRGLEAARAAYGPDAAGDSFRGLYVSLEQAARSLDGDT
jgi:hypothetical protein